MSNYVARDVLTVARVTEDGQSFEDLGIMERKAGQLIIKCQSYEQVAPSQEALMRRIDELCAEVERLKQQNVDVNGYVMPPYSEYERLHDENDKLRELMDELYPLADYGAMDESELDRAHDLMRELGIEVCA